MDLLIFTWVILNTLIIIGYNYVLSLFKYQTKIQAMKNIISYIGDKNIIFLKLCQWCWIKNDSSYYSSELVEHLNNYTNNAPYTKSDIDSCINFDNLYCVHEDGNVQQVVITERTPYNSGSLSIVFVGMLNGQKVAVKVLRADIQNKLLSNMKVLNTLFYFLNTFYPSKYGSNTIKLLLNNQNELLKQLDFKKEVSNIELFYNVYKKNKLIVVPKVYKCFTEKYPNIIVMDWVPGLNINQMNYEQKIEACPFYVRYVFSSYILKGVIHSDLHQGNVLFINSEIGGHDVWKIGLIDFGSVIEANVEEIDFIQYFLNGILNNEFEEFIEYSITNCEILVDLEYTDAFIQTSWICLELYRNKELFDVGKIANIDNDVWRFLSEFDKAGCQFKTRFYNILITLIPQIYIYKNLCQDVKYKYGLKDNLDKMKRKYCL